MKLIYYYYY